MTRSKVRLSAVSLIEDIHRFYYLVVACGGGGL